MAASQAIEGITFAQKVNDIKEKLTIAATVIRGILPGGDFQMGTETVRGIPYKVFKTLPPALGDYYRSFLTTFANREWLTYEDEHYSFADVQGMMDALAAELVSGFGIARGDRVAIAMRNVPEYMIAFLAITTAGAVAVPLNALWGSAELEYAVKDSGAKLLIADPERLQLCHSFLGALGAKAILCRGDSASAQSLSAVSWADVLKSGEKKPRPSLKEVKAEDDAMIMYTSGSTGFPKGVVHTQRSVGTAMKLGELLARATPEDEPRALLAVPLFHITALCNVFLWSLPSGTGIVLMRKWDAGEALKLIQEKRVTRFTGVPTMVRDMLEHPNFTPEGIATIKNMIAGGAPVPPTQVAKLTQKTKKATSAQGYGLTETMGGVTVNKGLDYLKHPTSCGKPIPFIVEVKIKDPATNKEVPNGQRGEVCIKSSMCMVRYHNKPEETKKAIDSEGFFHSGDVGKIEHGFVYILDRLKDMIIRGGENIDCSEVEAVMCMHPAVRECSVFALPDERLGEVVGAAIWTKGGVTAAELSAHAATKLAKFKVPEANCIFIHTDELPKGATGKIDKKGLRETYSATMKAPPMSKL